MYGERIYGRHTAQHLVQWSKINILKKVPSRAENTFNRSEDEPYFDVSAIQAS